jgi:glycosyltransferase involved in cell wall biosynthesis
MKSVWIDARMVGPIPHGISSYVSRLASGLSRLKLGYEPVFVTSTSFSREDFFGFKTVRAQSAFLSVDELWELPKLLREARPALYHSPSFSSLFSYGPFKAPCPWIVTIHDLNHLHYGDLKKKVYYRGLLRPFARSAAQIATVSQFSRDELASWLGVDAAEIEIVSNALSPTLMDPVSEEESRAVLGKYGLEPRRYFFCLSNPKPHKNVGTLVQGYLAYRQRGSAWPLVLNVDVKAPGVVSIGGVSANEARVLVACAGAVVFPSLYEGFGLPPVEAAVAGTAVVASDILPHREGLVELGEGEVRWADPRRPGDWAAALQQVQAGEIAPPSLESRRKTFEHFSEARLAAHMDRIYRRVLGV